MKKLILFISLLLFATIGYSQKYTLGLVTDTLTDADVGYYAYSSTWTKPWVYSAQVHVNHITGTADSVMVTFEGSMDGTNYFKLTNLGDPTCNANTASTTVTYYSALSAVHMKSAGGNWTGGKLIITPTWYLTVPYFRAKVQHAGTGTMTAVGYIYIKK